MKKKIGKGKKTKKHKQNQANTKYVKIAAFDRERFKSQKWSDGKVNIPVELHQRARQGEFLGLNPRKRELKFLQSF